MAYKEILFDPPKYIPHSDKCSKACPFLLNGNEYCGLTKRIVNSSTKVKVCETNLINITKTYIQTWFGFIDNVSSKMMVGNVFDDKYLDNSLTFDMSNKLQYKVVHRLFDNYAEYIYITDMKFFGKICIRTERVGSFCINEDNNLFICDPKYYRDFNVIKSIYPAAELNNVDNCIDFYKNRIDNTTLSCGTIPFGFIFKWSTKKKTSTCYVDRLIYENDNGYEISSGIEIILMY